MWSLRYQLWSLLGIPDLQIVPKPPDKYDGIIDEILLLPPPYLTNFEGNGVCGT